MLRNRIHHWTCSKFADFIRGEKKPFALEWGAWDDYYKDLKRRKPIRYWMTEVMLKHLQDILYYPYDLYNETKFYIHNRWRDKTHYLKTGLRPGDYHEFDERILHGLFNELVDYVEIELAHLSRWDITKKYKFKNGRCLEAVDDYFKWANNLKEKNDKGRKVLTPQAHDARKVQKLYEWWKNKRPNRPDPYEASGYRSVYKTDDDIFDMKNLRTRQKSTLDKLLKIEKQYDDEDTEMLTELIKLRHSLWT